MTIQINRYEIDATCTVYVDNRYCGMIFCPTNDGIGRSDYLASDAIGEKEQRAFPTENGAVEYLTT